MLPSVDRTETDRTEPLRSGSSIGRGSLGTPTKYPELVEGYGVGTPLFAS